MTDKQIKKKLAWVADKFLTLFDEPVLVARISTDMFFAGGCIVDQVLGEEPRDYDIFFKTEEVASAMRKYLEEHKDKLKALTTNAATMVIDGIAIQAVTRFVGPVTRIFKDFDYEHTKSYYDLETDQLVYNRDLILAKELRYTGEKDRFSLNTLKRLVKFTNRGWHVDNASLVALHKTCAKNDLNDPEVMRELAAGFYGSSFT